jgi:hypothetical protein
MGANLEQNQNCCTQRRDCQIGFFIKKNPISLKLTGHTYSDSALILLGNPAQENRQTPAKCHAPESGRHL